MVSARPLNPHQKARRAQFGEQRRGATRAQLLSAAYRLFARHGADTPTVDDIVVEAGVSRGSFYNHFATREELFGAVADDIATRINALIAAASETLLQALGLAQDEAHAIAHTPIDDLLRCPG